MTTTTIITTQQTLEVSPVTGVTVTTIEQDEDIGDYVREIRISGAAVGSNVPQVVVVRLRGTSESDLQITAPEQEF